MSPAEVKAARLKLGASPSQFGELVGADIRTVLGWESGSRPGPTTWQAEMIWALTVSPRCREIVASLTACGVATAFCMALEAIIARARSGAPLSADPAAQRPAQMPVTTTAATAELFA